MGNRNQRKRIQSIKMEEYTKSGPNLLFDEANFKIVEPDGIPLKQFY
jgi:hypothetical protein